MSHIVRQELEIRSLEDFAQACRQLNGALLRDVKTYVTREFGEQPCDHRVIFDGIDDQAALVRQEDASYRMHFAPYGDIRGKIGYDGKLMEKEYSIALQTRMYQKKGFRAVRTDLDGKTELRFERNV
jgi:hypothetical protein